MKKRSLPPGHPPPLPTRLVKDGWWLLEPTSLPTDERRLPGANRRLPCARGTVPPPPKKVKPQ